MARHFLFICAAMAFVGCSTIPKETDKGKSVKIIKSPFAETCIQLGLLRYDGTPFIHEKELSIIMKELTAQLKGNAMRLDTFTPGVTGVSNAKGRGTAYRCHKAKLKKYLLGKEDRLFGEDKDKESTDDPEFKAARDEQDSKDSKDKKTKEGKETKSPDSSKKQPQVP